MSVHEPDRPRILVVEDQEVIQDLLLTVFEREGMEARAAGGVAEGLAALAMQPTHLTLDLHLPDGRGTEILRHIREQQLPTLVAVTTGTIEAEMLESALRLHPDRVFQKPYRVSDVLRWIRGQDADDRSPPAPAPTSAPKRPQACCTN